MCLKEGGSWGRMLSVTRAHVKSFFFLGQEFWVNRTGVVPNVQLPRCGLLHFPLVLPAVQGPPQFPISFGESEESDWWGSGRGVISCFRCSELFDSVCRLTLC